MKTETEIRTNDTAQKVRRTWKPGDQLIGRVTEIVEPWRRPNQPRLTLVEVEYASGEKEAFVMLEVEHAIKPVLNHVVTMELQSGGPLGSYWKIVQ